MPIRTAYRQFHHQSNLATAVTVALAELGVERLDVDRRGEELVLHGLLQWGRYRQESGSPLRAALPQITRKGIAVSVRSDAKRTAEFRRLIDAANPDRPYCLPEEIGSPAAAFDPASDFAEDARLLLIESKGRVPDLALHYLLALGEGDEFYVMDSLDGVDHPYSAASLARHFATPVVAGPFAFASGLYLFTGLVVRLTQGEPMPLFKDE